MESAANKPTVMSSTANTPNPLVPPSLATAVDKMEWRQAVRYWAKRVDAFARGGDNRAKGARAALALTLFSSLPIAKQRLVEKQANTGEVDLFLDDDSLAAQLREVEKIMIIVAKDSATDRINRLAKLSREAHACKRENGETLKDFIERFSGPAAGYLNMAHADQASAESQNFAVALITNANLPSQVFTTVMGGLVMKAKESSDHAVSTIEIKRERALQAVASLQKFTELAKHVRSVVDAASGSSSISTDVISDLTGYFISCNEAVENAEVVSRVILASVAASTVPAGGEEAYTCITLADAISTLEEITLLPEDAGAAPTAGAMLAHTELANRFNNSNRYHQHRSRGDSDRRRGSRRGGKRNGKRNASDKGQGKDNERGQRRSGGSGDGEDGQPPKQKAKSEEPEAADDKKPTYF